MKITIFIAFIATMTMAPHAGATGIAPPAKSPQDITKACPFMDVNSMDTEAIAYDDRQPGADHRKVRNGFDAYIAGENNNAFQTWKPHAVSGNATAQYYLGVLFHGDGDTEETIPCAIAWYHTAAAQGHIDAIVKLGILKSLGDHKFIDQDEALSLLKFAAEKCHLYAQFQLGSFYGRTPRPHRDFVEAHKWLMIAGTRGHGEAKDTNKILRRFTSVAELREGNRRHKEWLNNNTCP